PRDHENRNEENASWRRPACAPYGAGSTMKSSFRNRMEQVFRQTSRPLGMRSLCLVVVSLVSACVSSGSTFCADGRVCHDGTVCATVDDTPRCVSPDQLAKCEGIAQFG